MERSTEPRQFPQAPRAALALVLILLAELAISLLLSRSDRASLVLVFAVGAVPTVPAFALLRRRWPRARSGWRRLLLCLRVAFVTYQVTLVLFALAATIQLLIAGPHRGLQDLFALPVFLSIVLLFGNLVFFPTWIALGILSCVLLRLLVGNAGPV